MSQAFAITQAMRGKWHGSYGYVKCVIHDDGRPSLRLRDGDLDGGKDARLLVHCHAGCNGGQIIEELKRRDLLCDAPKEQAVEVEKMREASARRDTRGTAAARHIWDDAKGQSTSLVERYLRNRGITLPLPPTLRFHRALLHAESKRLLPAMVGAVQGPDRSVVGVHRTYISPTGTKASVELAKMSLGPISGGAVRLAAAAETLAICEGIETGLSYMQLTGIPTWAALSTSGIRSIVLPKIVRTVIIAHDHDEIDPRTGMRPGLAAAEAAARRFESEWRIVQFATPAYGLKDFNDMLITGNQNVAA